MNATASPENLFEFTNVQAVDNLINDTTDTYSTAIDVASKGFAYALPIYHVSLMDAQPTVVTKLQESDDNVTFTDIAGTGYDFGNGAALSTSQALIRLRGRKRYIRFLHNVDKNGGAVSVFGYSLLLLSPQYPANQSSSYIFNLA